MNTLLIIVASVLAAAAFGDGYTTYRSVKVGNIETDPLIVDLYGTNKPTAKDLFGKGSLVIAGEILAMLATAHFTAVGGYIIAAALSVQAAIHVYEVFHNSKLY